MEKGLPIKMYRPPYWAVFMMLAWLLICFYQSCMLSLYMLVYKQINHESGALFYSQPFFTREVELNFYLKYSLRLNEAIR